MSTQVVERPPVRDQTMPLPLICKVFPDWPSLIGTGSPPPLFHNGVLFPMPNHRYPQRLAGVEGVTAPAMVSTRWRRAMDRRVGRGRGDALAKCFLWTPRASQSHGPSIGSRWTQFPTELPGDGVGMSRILLLGVPQWGHGTMVTRKVRKTSIRAVAPAIPCTAMLG